MTSASLASRSAASLVKCAARMRVRSAAVIPSASPARILRSARSMTAAALGCVVLIGVPIDLIETPLFSRAVPPNWWSYPVLAVSALLAGLLVATYVNGPTGPGPRHDDRWGSFGGALTFFAVGCPVCNKVVLLALGASGALRYFGPLQPLLALGSVALLAWALHQRLRNTNSCPLPPQPAR